MTPGKSTPTATQVAEQLTPRMSPIQRIVVAIGGSDSEFVAQQWAINLAASLGIKVMGVHVAVEGSEPPRDVFTYAGRLAEKWKVGLQTHVTWGKDVAKALVDELSPTDLLVMGTRKMARQFHIGSVAAELVRIAPCPVQLVRLTE